jgi:V/A-type H+-transporting ATPase subunit K
LPLRADTDAIYFEEENDMFESFGGSATALMGASLAAGLCLIGSAKGAGIAGEAAGGLLSENPSAFGKTLILQYLPLTQGLFGLLVWFLAVNKLGLFSGGLRQIDMQQGWQVFFACLPMALGGLVSAISHGRVAAGAILVLAKKPGDWSKGLALCIAVWLCAVLSLAVSCLMLGAISF